MNHMVCEMVAYFHESRPHQAKDNDLLVPAEDTENAEEPEVVFVERGFGGGHFRGLAGPAVAAGVVSPRAVSGLRSPGTSSRRRTACHKSGTQSAGGMQSHSGSLGEEER